uniref:Uncharacterized protein n=1 Tax=Avena sativa TaxID=4498 RepID=A0ACD5T6I5_AVESA
MPGSIKITDIQPPVTTPLFLQVAVGKREYSGNIGQDAFSFPVTSLRDSMVMTLYDADKELVSKTDVNTKAIVELGMMDVVFSLHSGRTIILQLKFLLSDEDRKRVQEMRNSAVKRKQQELLANGYKLRFQDIPSPKEQNEDIPDIPGKEDQLTLRKSMSLDDLKERDALSRVTVDSDLTASKELPLRSGGSTSMLEGPIDTESKKGQGKSSSAVKKMISAFESSSPQVPHSIPRIKSESSLEGVSVSSDTSTNSSIKPPTPGASLSTRIDLVAGTSGKVTITSADASSSLRKSGKQVMFGNKKPATSRQAGVSNPSESRRRTSSRRDRTSKTSMGDSDSIRSEKHSAEKHRHRSIGAYLSEQQKTIPSAAASSITWIHPHVCITTASRQLRNRLNHLLPLMITWKNGDVELVDLTLAHNLLSIRFLNGRVVLRNDHRLVLGCDRSCSLVDMSSLVEVFHFHDFFFCRCNYFSYFTPKHICMNTITKTASAEMQPQ